MPETQNNSGYVQQVRGKLINRRLNKPNGNAIPKPKQRQLDRGNKDMKGLDRMAIIEDAEDHDERKDWVEVVKGFMSCKPIGKNNDYNNISYSFEYL